MSLHEELTTALDNLRRDLLDYFDNAYPPDEARQNARPAPNEGPVDT